MKQTPRAYRWTQWAVGIRSSFLNILLGPAVLQSYLRCVWYLLIIWARKRRSNWCWATKNWEHAVMCIVACQHIPSMSLIRTWSWLLAWKPLRGLARVVWLDVQWQMAVDLPLPLPPLLQLPWSTLIFRKLCRKLCTIEAHIGCRDLLGLRASWLTSRICERFVFCSTVLLAFNSGLR